jgi:uncharacterized protein (DUF58 family)
MVAARRIAATVTLGSHGRRRAGTGETFWQFRPYSRDDTPQSIDWRQTAKFDHVYVRDREWVAAQTIALWCDASPSMHYRSERNLPTKAERAAVLTLALGVLLIEGGERVLRLSAGGDVVRAAATGRLAMAQLADALAAELAAANSVKPSFVALPRHGAVALIGDFLAPLPDIAAAIRQLSAHGAAGYLLQVLDPAEESLPFKGRIRFVGLENEGAAIIERTEEARSAYARRLAAHRAGLKDLTQRAGWSFAVHHTDHPPETALAALHQAMTGFASSLGGLR